MNNYGDVGGGGVEKKQQKVMVCGIKSHDTMKEIKFW